MIVTSITKELKRRSRSIYVRVQRKTKYPTEARFDYVWAQSKIKVHNTFVTSWKHCIMPCQNRIYLPSGDPMKVWCNNLFFPPFISDKTRKYILFKQTSNRYRFVTKMLKIYPQSNFWKGFKTKQQPHSPFRSSCSTQKVDHCALDILDIRLRNQQRLIMNSDI